MNNPESDELANKPSSSSALPFGFARRYGVVVDLDSDENLVLHKGDLSLRTIAEVQRFVGHTANFSQVADDEFDALLSRAYSGATADTRLMVENLGDEIDITSLADAVPVVGDLLEQEDNAPVIRLINSLLAKALQENASDIHIETFESSVQIRFRVDGVLREVGSPKRELAPLIVSRIKVMSKLDIAEKRIPQDGRASIRIGGRELDIRISVMPTGHGERVVMRLLDKQSNRLTLTNLGMSDETLGGVQNLVSSAHGIFLVTGPTGSGKTTTLYASLSELETEALNVLTVEDPVEYNLKGIGQTQVNTRTGMTFARGLRAMLRQDPDIVMVGEIRDLETAEIAVQASLTGHLVLSTLHTNTASGTITRLVDMGVESYLIATSTIGVLAQRLVRVLCTFCREPHTIQPFEADFLNHPTETTIYDAKGCDRCRYTGYSGRTGIYELVTIDSHMRQMIHDQESEQLLADYAHQRNPSIRADGCQKILSGITTIQEVMRVTLET